MKVAVVGAGTAGCLVTRRLRDAGHMVTLIEAGPGDLDPGSASVDWLGVQAAPERSWSGLRVRRELGADREPYVVGRGVGGGSAINGLVSTFGPDAAYDAWPVIEAEQALERIRLEHPVTEADPGLFGAAMLASNPGPLVGRRAPLSVVHGQRNVTDAQSVRSGLRSDAKVIRLDVNGAGRVVGVELDDGEVLQADHTIVCAGALATPSLLLRSGIDESGIGAGLTDHPSRVITIELDSALQLPSGTTASPITTMAHWEGIDVLLMDHTGSTPQGRTTGAALVVLMDPESTGSVTLDDEGNPDIQFRMLADGADRARLDAGVDRTMDWLSELGSTTHRLAPGLGPVSHAAASCRVGSSLAADGSVVGIEGVSVMDASALPGIPRAHPMLPTLVVTEALSAEWLRRHDVGHHHPT